MAKRDWCRRLPTPRSRAPSSSGSSAWPRPSALRPASVRRSPDAYTIEKELGGGSMGVVFTAFDPALARRVAVKLIRSPLLSADFRARFMLEARAMARVSHPNVVTIHALGEHEGNPFMVMELVEGETLEFWMYRHGPQPDLDQALRILNDVWLGRDRNSRCRNAAP